MQPLPTSQLQRSQPSVEHHEEDACQSEGDGQKGSLSFAEAVVEGRGMIVGHVWTYYSKLAIYNLSDTKPDRVFIVVLICPLESGLESPHVESGA